MRYRLKKKTPSHNPPPGKGVKKQSENKNEKIHEGAKTGAEK
jgi:hypothetical protein